MHLIFGVLPTMLVASGIAVFFSIEQNYVAIDFRTFGCLEKVRIIFFFHRRIWRFWLDLRQSFWFLISSNRVSASFSYFALISSTYHDAEVVKRIAVTKFFRVVVHVWREKLTKKFIVDIREGLYVERKTWRSFQTGQRALWDLINKNVAKGSDIQVGEFVFLEVCITEDITSAYSNLSHFSLKSTRLTINWKKSQKKLCRKEICALFPSSKRICSKLKIPSII